MPFYFVFLGFTLEYQQTYCISVLSQVSYQNFVGFVIFAYKTLEEFITEFINVFRSECQKTP